MVDNFKIVQLSKINPNFIMKLSLHCFHLSSLIQNFKVSKLLPTTTEYSLSNVSVYNSNVKFFKFKISPPSPKSERKKGTTIAASA